MKKTVTYLLSGAIFFAFSCKSSSDAESGHSSAKVLNNADSDEIQMPEYYDLLSNRPVDIMEDSETHQYVDVSTQMPLIFYYDAISHDTFDIRGRIVNNALSHSEGEYSIDETKIKSNADAFKFRTEELKKKSNLSPE